MSDEAKEHHLQPDVHAEELRGLVGRGGREGGRVSVWLERREGREKTSCLFTKRSCQPANLKQERDQGNTYTDTPTKPPLHPLLICIYLSYLHAGREHGAYYGHEGRDDEGGLAAKLFIFVWCGGKRESENE